MNSLRTMRVAILGYGNQGRAQALNLRDSGVDVIVGARAGKGAEAARTDGFEVCDFKSAVTRSQVVMFLLPDPVIPSVYAELLDELTDRWVGFAHGFAFCFGGLKLISNAAYFLVSPKGAGAWLRHAYETKTYLPGVFALGTNPKSLESRHLVTEYAAAIGVAQRYLLETTFQEEAECDLFGEQAVLCGGIPELMERAFQILIENGHSPEMAFFECCYEAKLIVDLFVKFGPSGMAERISPTAFYGGKTVGKRLIDERVIAEMRSVFSDIRSGKFARAWMDEAKNGAPANERWGREISGGLLQKTYESIRDHIQE